MVLWTLPFNLLSNKKLGKDFKTIISSACQLAEKSKTLENRMRKVVFKIMGVPYIKWKEDMLQ